MNTNPDISVIVPVYNSATILPELYQRTEMALEALNLTFEILLIDDGSSDESWQMILDLKKTHLNKIKGFKLARNSGQQAATFCGLKHATGSWVITMDDDLQTPPEEFFKVIEESYKGKADIIYGVYLARRHSFIHNVGTRIFRFIFRHVAPDYPDGSSFRLIKGTILKSFPDDLGPWIFVDPILVSITGNITSVKVRHEKNNKQKSRYSFFKLIGLAITLLIVYSTFPLRMIIGLGFSVSLISFGIGIYFIYRKLTLGAPIGFSALIVTVAFASGVILLCLGVLGEYISRIYTLVTKRPSFTIQTTT